MIKEPSPWALPGLRLFVGSVEAALCDGIAAIAADPGMPVGLDEVLRGNQLSHFVRVEEITFSEGDMPLIALGGRLGTQCSIAALRTFQFDQTLAVIRMPAKLDGRIGEMWKQFWFDYRKASSGGDPGLAILLIDTPDLPGLTRIEWTSNLRKGDLVIWAEEHLPATRSGLVGELAINLAVELCGWRLGLAADLVRASIDDLADVLSWLSRRDDEPLPGSRRVGNQSYWCPIELMRSKSEELSRRIWRAHLASLFPWLEEQRLAIVAKNRARLQLDSHLRSNGISDIDEIELGSLRYQLSRFFTATERDSIERLARIRNALAHRKPARFDDLRPNL